MRFLSFFNNQTKDMKITIKMQANKETFAFNIDTQQIKKTTKKAAKESTKNTKNTAKAKAKTKTA
jgi:hypothetical protein